MKITVGDLELRFEQVPRVANWEVSARMGGMAEPAPCLLLTLVSVSSLLSSFRRLPVRRASMHCVMHL